VVRRVVVSEFVSLDGVMEAPDQWHFQFWHDEMGKYNELFASDALLLGRVSYQGFAEAWPSMAHHEEVVAERMTDADRFTERMNSIAKYVVSTTLDKAEWTNSHLIKGDVAEEVGRLKQQSGLNILVAGSADLIHTLMQHDLVDEYRLMVHPVVVGHGKRLFRDGVDTAVLRLTETKTFPTGVINLTYVPAGREAERS
jgi:dihydrofolate reductase